MNVKRFVAANMRRALELVKQEMGDDAIILSSKRIKEGVEILTSSNLPLNEAHATARMADSYSNYGASKQSLPTDTRANLFSRDHQAHTGLADDVGMHGYDVAGWNNTIQASRDEMRGQASGKTRQQLAREIEIARRKMEAADRIPLAQQESWPSPRNSVSQLNAAQPNAGQLTAAQRQNSASPSRSQTPKQRIEPRVPNYIDEDLLAAMEDDIAPVDQYDAAIPGLHSPFASATGNYVWRGPSDLSNYLIYPEADGIDDDDTMEFDQQDLQLQALKDEISDMREMLHVQLERLQRSDRETAPVNNPVSLAAAIKATIGRRLTQMGFTDGDVAGLLKRTKVRAGLAETWADVLAALSQQLPVCAKDSICNGGVFALVGPAGAGKTATVSKLATRFVLQHPRRRLSIIVLEEQNAKQSPLVRLGKLLDVPVQCVSDRGSLARALAQQAGDDLVLIDTPSCRFDGKSNFLRAAFSCSPQVEKVLVLPANAQAKSLTTAAANYQALGVTSCVLTKLDECASLGEAMSVVLQARLPLAYFTQGQRIPDDLQTARGYQLVTKAVALLKQEQNQSRKIENNRSTFQSGQQSLSA